MASVICAEAIEAAKEGDQHQLRSYLDEQDGDVNLRDLDTQGTLLHVREELLDVFHRRRKTQMQRLRRIY